MLKIHQPYKYKSKYILALSSAGVFLLGSLWFGCRLWELSSDAKQLLSRNSASAAGDWRTIHDIENMQEMNQQICSNTEEGDTENLLDSRGGVKNYYKIMKMPDGTCWMVENLRLKGGVTITSSDSDVNSDYTLPPNASTNSSTMNWDADNDTAYMAEGSTNMKLYGSSPWREAYGNYYSWCAATAMSCRQDRTGSALTNTDAPESICPKNWKLPVGTTGKGSFQSLYDNYPKNMSNTYWLTNQTIPYNGSTSTGYNGKRFGSNAVDALFSASGYVLYSYGLSNASSNGYYWSRRAYSGISNAYYLGFSSDAVGPQYDYPRCYGYSVRCVALGGLDKVEKPPVWQETADTGINVTVPKVLTLDVSDGVNTTADAYNVVKGEIVAIVTSNNIDYEVLLSSEQPSLIGQKDSTNYIPVVSNTNPVEKGNNAWGILNSSNLYDAITTTPQQFYNTITTNDKSTSHTYGVGISISPTLPADTYSTTVTVTASSK